MMESHAAAVKNTVLAVLAGVGSYLAKALGGWDEALNMLLFLMAADYATGLMVAGIWHKSNKTQGGALDSRAGFQGLVRKGMVLLLVLVGVRLDRAMGTRMCRNAVILFFSGNEGLSLLENLGLMGVPFPQFIRKALEALRDQGDSGTVQ